MITELLETQARVVADTAHRPWPPPVEPWVLAQTWVDLLFAHWRVPVESVRGLGPAELDVDEYDGSAWLAVTPFVLTACRFRGTLPLPWISTFPELNVRPYVTAEARPGIWFFSLDTSSRVAVEGPRRAYKLPYFHARISAKPWRGGLRYTCARVGSKRRFEGRYRATGQPPSVTRSSGSWPSGTACMRWTGAGSRAPRFTIPPGRFRRRNSSSRTTRSHRLHSRSRATLVPFLTPSGRRDLAASTDVSAVGTPQEAPHFDVYSGWQPKARRGE